MCQTVLLEFDCHDCECGNCEEKFEKKKWSLTKAQVMSVMDDDPSEKSNMRNNFPLLVSFLKMEMEIVMS